MLLLKSQVRSDVGARKPYEQSQWTIIKRLHNGRGLQKLRENTLMIMEDDRCYSKFS